MEYYFAPMEGVTGYLYRNAYNDCFGSIDRYYTPFIAANKGTKLKNKEIADILPEHNKGITIIPQILTCQSEDYIRCAKDLASYGYQEINLNLGCPSGTVVSKGRGSGFLAHKKELDEFLYEIFEADITDISIKTRIGMDSPDEFAELMDIYNKYPIKELIIHPRIRHDYYKNTPNLEVFGEALKVSKNPVCYNGDIFSKDHYDQLMKRFPELNSVMIGRGILINPGLIREIKEGIQIDKKSLRAFHDRIYGDYKEHLSGDTPVLYKMKELWFYMTHLFEDSAKLGKKIRKANRLADYESSVAELFASKELIHGRIEFTM